MGPFAQIWAKCYFLEKRLSVFECSNYLPSCKKSEKNNGPFVSEKNAELTDWGTDRRTDRTDRQTNRQTDTDRQTDRQWFERTLRRGPKTVTITNWYRQNIGFSNDFPIPRQFFVLASTVDWVLVFLGTQNYSINGLKKPVFPGYLPFLWLWSMYHLCIYKSISIYVSILSIYLNMHIYKIHINTSMTIY